MLKLVFLLLFIGIYCDAEENLTLLSKKRSSFLDTFRNYASLSIFQIEIPPLITFVSFKISAEPFDLSIFGCSPEKVYVYAKKGSIPVLNPYNWKNPKWTRNITNSELYELELLTDKEFSYINITAPDAGIYYFTAFFPYVNPDSEVIKQKGLSQHCTGFINILAYISKSRKIHLVSENFSYHIDSRKNEIYYQFSPISSTKETMLKLRTSGPDANVTIRLSCDSLPSVKKSLETRTIIVTDKNIDIPYWFNKEGQYFLEFDFNQSGDIEVSLDFSLETISPDLSFKRRNLNIHSQNKLDPKVYRSALLEYYEDPSTKSIDLYTSYDLIKETGSEPFLFTYNIKHEEEQEFMIPIALNLTSNDFSVLKFKIEDIIDTGGTFEFSIDFRTQTSGTGQIIFSPESVDQIIIGCISQDMYQIPTLPRFCVFNGKKTIAPVVLNNTVDNSTVLIPFPESGTWYATIKLFCKPCRDCSCYKRCTEELKSCVSKCSCDTVSSCNACSRKCKANLEKKRECRNCNCDNNCQESKSSSCSSSIMFDLSSFPCFMGKCGPNGRCQYVLVDGYFISACQCRNKYRGLDCTDDSMATPFWKIVLEQFLLISSNLIMLPCVYIAIRRKYYPESVMYLFVFIFSSFYHACDVADDAIQFCLTSHASLQFADFFTALFSIWATMLVIADLEIKHRAILHVLAAILLAYCTVIDKTGIWIFLLVSIPGLTIISICWYFKYRKSGKNFIRRNYIIHFCCGVVVMIIGIMIFAFFQTNGNYMYLHSLWHCIVGFTVIIILPYPDTFYSLHHPSTEENT